MTDDEHDEISGVHKRIDDLVTTIRWALGIAAAFATSLGLAMYLSSVAIEGRVSSLESSRENTIETIKRIDRNVEELARYLRGTGP